MRIAYFAQMADVAHGNGITKKIKAQITTWQSAGHTVRYFALADNTTVWSGFASIDSEIVKRGRFLQRFTSSRGLTSAIYRWGPDVIYYRFGHYIMGLTGLFNHVPAIAEINSDDLREYPLIFPFYKVLYHRATRSRLINSVAALVPVTNELDLRFRQYKKPTLTLGNSISLGDYVPCSATGVSSRDLVFLGAPGTPWHGMDRIVELATNMPDWTFNIIGPSPLDEKTLPRDASIPSNMKFLGYLGSNDYIPILQRSVAALGSFGLWRNRMDEACPLKVREYLAYGLPVIGGYIDTDIPYDADYFLRLPNDRSSVEPHLNKIRDFLSRWQTRRVPRTSIQHLDTSFKEQIRLKFIAAAESYFRGSK